MPYSGSDKIRIQGAREHNLKNIDLEIPRESLTVFTGVSGSGKSSLAHDIIYQEGQRRFIESLSPYARQFLGQMEKPQVDHIEGLSPAIAIDQKRSGRSSRSTVGTLTEIYDHLRLLFARLGQAYCPNCQVPITSLTIDQISQLLLNAYTDQRALIMAPVVIERKGEYRKELQELKADGFVRIRIDGQVRRLDEPIALARYAKHTLEVVIDRLVLRPEYQGRLQEALEQAVELAAGLVAVLIGETHRLFSTQRACPRCGLSLPEIEPRLFSFNNPQGACPMCQGSGYTEEFQVDLLVPDKTRSLLQGALTCITGDGRIIFSRQGLPQIKRLAKHYGVALKQPWEKLPAAFRQRVLYGDAEQDFAGVIPIMRDIYHLWHLYQFRRYLSISTCTACQGTRLRSESLHVLFREKNIAQLAALTIGELNDFFAQLELSPREQLIGRQLFKEIRNRLRFLNDVGLGYLTLDRRANTLAGGEAQRLRLARQLGAGLQGVLYVLDEPSIGLHARDNQRLLQALGRLRDMGNCVLVVEHDEATIRAADHVVDLGPGAGEQGGQVVVAGSLARLCRRKRSLTGRYLAGHEHIELPPRERRPGDKWLEVLGAAEHNLQNIDVRIPLGLFVCVTGVSGSGKSTLVDLIIKRALARHWHHSQRVPGRHRAIKGLQWLDKVIEVDQSPIGRTPRSNPGTYTKVFDEIRRVFAQLPLSRARGYKPGRFSFNVPGGRCESCQGAGQKEIQMQFLSNVFITCEVCQGRRFNPETLEVEYKGKNISQILEMRVDQALEFWSAIPKIQRILQTLHDVGLGYLTLGQPSPQLSGGEAQRIKLARELRRPDTGKTLYILDEPTTGLHFADIQILLYALDQLVQRGNTVLVIEHNLDVISNADYIIDLGPEGGAQGGRVVVCGDVATVQACAQSYTGQALRAYQDARQNPPAPRRARRRKRPRRSLIIHGATKHNLKNISLEIPHGAMTVITGPSGSGKTSLAFDTIFAEGQRRFIESLSTYARRFLGRLERGEVQSVNGLAPAIAIDQKTASKNPRSTVATLTEIYDYLRLLYARVGDPHCPYCGRALQAYEPSTAAATLQREQVGSGLVLAPLHLHNWHATYLYLSYPKDLHRHAAELRAQGFTRVLVGTQIQRLEKLGPVPEVEKPIYLIIDRLNPRTCARARLAESLAQAMHWGGGLAFFQTTDQTQYSFTRQPACLPCGYYQIGEFTPRMFSFNSHQGACEYCDGLGQRAGKVCGKCQGQRLKPACLAVLVGGLSIAQFCALRAREALEFIEQLQLDQNRTIIAQEIRKEISHRLRFLIDVGLDYLALDRRGDTLSGGEAQRIRLATQIGNRLVGVLYVLDEPTIGMHPRDTQRLLNTLRELTALDNTVLVVEHDLLSIQAADFVVDLGPGAGEHGGEVIACGTPAQIARHPRSLTGAYLRGQAQIPLPPRRCAPKAPAKASPAPNPLADPEHFLVIRKASKNNLKGIDVPFRHQALNVVTGVSGSGKSTLVMDILQQYWYTNPTNGKTLFGRPGDGFYSITGIASIMQMHAIDQSPIGLSAASNPATFTGLMTPIREIFALLPGSRRRGFTKARFSFNRSGGRCEQCQGRGFLKIEMHFLSDVWVPCEACQGKRYLAETLKVRYHGYNIAQVLDMTVSQALELFQAHRKITRILKILVDVGLGYLHLGQPANTLSGGEAQRLKLARELVAPRRGHTLYLLDEPTTGLHLEDVKKLLQVLLDLVAQKHTVIVIEHHLDVIKCADWIVDLGPEGGEQGGEVVAMGPVEQIIQHQSSHTARFLRQVLPPTMIESKA